ncbi:putative glycoside hydrolase [Nonomuraea sp. NPDC050328]|uniref:putative glycoside hydrolase n=1 Tax=Nonomuraea sp. NPDC050328 TaxID=3364361 RepID=UPI0037A6B5E5
MMRRLLTLTALAAVLVAGTATSAGAGRRADLLQPRTQAHGISRGQVFDNRMPDRSVYQGRVPFVWGAYPLDAQPPDVVPSRYLPAIRDNGPARTLSWYQANHPDWIMYQADRTSPVIQGGSSPIVTLDVANPAVREFYFTTLVLPNIQAGYRWIALDNVVPWNWTAAAGHYDASGAWVQQYSGLDDPAYAQVFLDWLCWLRNKLHKYDVGLAGNISPLGANAFQRDKSAKAVRIVDLWLHEGGFTRARDSNILDGEWAQTFALYRSVVPAKPVVSVGMTTGALATASQSQIDWIIANYLLVREPATMLALVGRFDYGYFVDRPELDLDLGAPTAAPAQHAGGLWYRDYQRGRTVVNPSSTATSTLPLPAGTWTDSHGAAHTGQVTLAPNSGLILTRS